MDLFGDAPSEEDSIDFIDDAPFLATEPQGMQPPHKSDIFFGHEQIEKEMLALWNSGRMPHALVLNGLKGVGKATFAYRLARFVLNETDDSSQGLFGGEDVKPANLALLRDNAVFQRVASGGHSDIMTLARPFDDRKGEFKNEIPVDDIRKVAPFLRKTSGAGGWRVVIIDDANCMNRSGQNALLKILEEPPKNALLILVTHGAGGLLPTIRSRCRFVAFDVLSDDILNDLMDMAAGSPLMPNDSDILTALAQGSAGQAIDLLERGGIEVITNILECLASLPDATEEDIDRFSLSFGKSGAKDVIDQFIFVLRWWFQTTILLCVNGQSSKHVGHLSIKIPNGHDLQSLLRLSETVEAHIHSCKNGNLDTRYMIFKTLRMIQNG